MAELDLQSMKTFVGGSKSLSKFHIFFIVCFRRYQFLYVGALLGRFRSAVLSGVLGDLRGLRKS